MTELLSQISVLFLYSAMGLYAAAFVAFALDLARRSARVTARQAQVPSAAARRAEAAAGETAADADAQTAEPAMAGASAGASGAQTAISGTRGASGGRGAASGPSRSMTATLTRFSGRVEDDLRSPAGRSSSMRVAFILTIVGFGLHLVADILRGVAAARVPWANMYEFSMTGTLIIVGVFLLVNIRYRLGFLGAFITGLILVLLGISTVRYYVAVVPLPPALQSYWLVIHVLVATLGTGMFALGFALSAVQLVQTRREAMAGTARAVRMRFLETLPSSAALENLAYRINVVGFILWTFTLMAGAIWAEKAWGRYWGWDTKEVWTFIIWVLYAGYIHARATRGWSGTPSAWLSIVGFGAVMFNFGIVNVFFHGLHSYSGL